MNKISNPSLYLALAIIRQAQEDANGGASASAKDIASAHQFFASNWYRHLLDYVRVAFPEMEYWADDVLPAGVGLSIPENCSEPGLEKSQPELAIQTQKG